MIAYFFVVAMTFIFYNDLFIVHDKMLNLTWIIMNPLQCAVSLLKADIYRITSIPPEHQRIKFKVKSLTKPLTSILSSP